jgi:prophage regulatory protein
MNEEQRAETTRWSTYDMARRPTSAGRILLAEVLEEVMFETCGLREGGIAEAFAADDEIAGDERASIRSFAMFIGQLIQDGELSTWVRPFGGGELQTFPASKWEIDDFERRFASSAVDPARWADPNASPTHWIFVSRESLDAWWETWNNDHPEDQGPALLPIAVETLSSGTVADRPGNLSFLRVSEVETRTGMSRSTIYEKIRSEGFPEPVRLSARMSRWLDGEVDAWLRTKM